MPAFPAGGRAAVTVPHVYYQDRADGIRTPRELFERVIAPSSAWQALPDGWFGIYTDVNADRTRKIVVIRKGDARAMQFPVPAFPQFR